MYYAQIDADKICFAVTQTAGSIDRDDMVLIASYDDTLLGKRYLSETGGFEYVPVPEPEPAIPQPTMDEIKENQLILMDAVATLFETMISEPI